MHWRELQHLSRAERHALQNRLLRRFVEERLLPFSPYYSQLFAEHGLRAEHVQRVEDLARVPFTTKKDLAPSAEDPDRPRRFLLQPSRELIAAHWSRGKRARLVARALLRGKRHVAAALRREYYPIFMTFTTGRSAQPVPFLYTRHDLDIVSEAGARLCETLGFLPDERGLNVFPFAPHLAFWQVSLGAMQVGNLMLHTGGGKVAGTEGNLRGISRLQPQNLLGVPGYIYHMLREARARGQRVEGLRKIVLGADAVPAGLKLKLRTLCAELGSPDVRVLGTYGFTEARMAFAECPTNDGSSSGYHVFPDFGIFEVIDPATGEVLPSEADGELVFTPLQGRGTTIFRYRTGDLVQGGISEEPCPHCGRKLPRISSKLSRATSVHSVSLKKVKGTLVDLEELGRILADDLEVEEWQVLLRKKDDDPHEVDELIVFIAPRPGCNEKSLEERLRSAIHSSCEVRPNEFRFLPIPALLERVGMEREMKEKRFLDTRSLA